MGKEDIDRIANKISNWWSNSHFESDRADRLLEKFNSGPDKFIDPELSASENWQIIKGEYNLKTKRGRDHDRESYRQKARKRELKEMNRRRGDLIAVERLNVPAGAVVADISECFGHNPVPSDHMESMNLNIPTGLEQALNRIEREEELDTDNTTPQETQRGLLRFGGPEVVRLIYEDILEDHDGTLPEFREMTKCSAEYVPGKSQGYLDMDTKRSLDIPGDTTARQSFRVYPWQKEIFEWVSDQLRISQNDAYRWALAVAANEWVEDSDYLPDPAKEGLDELVHTCHSQLREEAETVRLSFILTVTEAFEEGYGEDVLDDCFSGHPTLLLDYLNTTKTIGKEVEKYVKEYPGDIADEMEIHPLDVLDEIPDPLYRRFS